MRRVGFLALLVACALGSAPASAATVEFGDTSSTYRPADVTIGLAEAVTFTGSFADHPLEWDFGDHPAQETGSELVVSGFGPGTYQYYCRFHGSRGGSGMAGVIRVPGNAAPTVTGLAASDVTPDVGEVVTFTVQGAADSDGTVTHVDWDLDGNGIFEQRTTAQSVTRSYATAGARTVRARVFDNGHDQSAPVQVSIDVIADTPGPVVTTIAFGGVLGLHYDPADVSVPAGQGIAFAGAFSDHPLAWDFADRPRRSEGAAYALTPDLAPGTYRYFCEVHGAPGGLGMAGVIRIPGNQAPALGGVSATPASAAAGETVTLTATGAADADGTVTHYEWDLDADGAFERRTATATTTVAYATAGTRTVRARALDSGHDPSPPVQSTVTVSEPPSGPSGPGPGPPPAQAPGGTPQPPPGTPSPGGDRVRPTIRLTSTALRLRDGRVRIALRLSEPARLTVVIKRGTRVLGRRSLKATKSGALTLSLAVRGRAGRIVLEIAARDAAGNTGRLRRSLTLRR